MSVKDRVEAIEADITTLELDAIVNAANEALIRGGGVDGAIRRKAGHEMEEELRQIGRCPTGKAVITRGARLPVKFVIHTVAPVFGRSGKTAKHEADLLAACYANSLALADEYSIRSLAFPCIGTGVYGWPAETAAEIAFRAVAEHLKGCEMQQRIVFCCFNATDHERYARLIAAA